MDSVLVKQNNIAIQEVTTNDRLEIIEDGMRKKYLVRLADMEITPAGDMQPLEADLIDNVRMFRITEMVYQKGEPATDKFTTVFNTISTYNASVFILMDSDGRKTDFYLGVRNNEKSDALKRSSVTLGDTLKNTLIGHFPGTKIENTNRKQIAILSEKIASLHNVASVSVVGSNKNTSVSGNEQFVQGLEKLALAMEGRKYMGLIIAENQDPQKIIDLRKNYQDLYTKLSPFQKVQFSSNESQSVSRSKSFSEMDGKQKAGMIASAMISMAGVVGGAALGNKIGAGGPVGGAMLGGQVTGQLNSLITSLAPAEQTSNTKGSSTSTTTENKMITDLLQLLDDAIMRANEFDSYGMWNVASYFISDDMSAAEIAASNYRSLMNGENSGKELSAINSWRSNNPNNVGDFSNLTLFLSRFHHPAFYYDSSRAVLTNATTAVSGKELGLHMGLPRATVSGLPVIEHAEFGKEVTTYQLFSRPRELSPEERMTLGRVFDLGKITNKIVELDNKSLNMHTFITGSTGSGKSNTVYQMLCELHQDKIPFLVVEPAKGEYKDVFGNWEDVNVYSTNPNIAELIHLNPFMFPPSIHVLEHIDGLVEIFGVCWPMYDAMPAFFKDAILRSYEAVGWDLGSSTFEGKNVVYPDFDVLAEQLDQLIEHSDYASDIKSNYRGALITRVKSLTVGLNKYLFNQEQTSYQKLFDENCILDISRVKSSETKALIMGLMVYILNEYRVDRKDGTNKGIEHITVLEEAHNLLKNTSGGASELTGKSVEMLTQTIAEIRTYGEGFIIVDQSPSSVDIAAIKNTNTKIVLRTPEANDREAVGRSMGLTADQVNEIAKLPSGVAVVYQNNWINPVLTMIDKANITESPYILKSKTVIKPIKLARTQIATMLIQQWINAPVLSEGELRSSLNVLDVNREDRNTLSGLITDYTVMNGLLVWRKKKMPVLRKMMQATLNIKDKDIEKLSTPEELTQIVKDKIQNVGRDYVNRICYVLTYVEES